MSDTPYQVRGPGIALMRGREQLFKKLCHHLTKPTPDHMCVVGPRSFGKSVLLNHLASHFKDKDNHYVTSLYWDLRHSTPETDDEFRRRFAEKIKSALQPVQPDLAECLELEDESLLYLLRFVFEEMDRKQIRLLAVLDGFDHVLAKSNITRNLWDEMRDFGQRTCLRLVTGSRRRLRELCRTEESQTSDFWEIFYDTPLQVGCFDKHDWNDFLDPFKLHGVTLDSSARKEIINWTGGVPELAAALANRLISEVSDEVTISKPHVDNVAETMLEEGLDSISDLWRNDCSIDLRSDLVELTDRDVPLSEVPDQRSRDLQLRGFARLSRNKLQSSCRFMVRYAQQQASEVANLNRLFGDVERFNSNIQSLLELRLAQVRGADPKLKSYVEKAIRDLHPEPTESLGWARAIALCALDLIWTAELPADKSLPHNWKFPSDWKSVKGGHLPERRYQCGMLNIITGIDKYPRVSKFVTKPTYLFVQHLYSVGNFGQHMEESTVSMPIAATFCLSAISLCESLARDLAISEEEV